MADIMRVSSAVSTRNQQSALQKPAEPSEVFELGGVDKLTAASAAQNSEGENNRDLSQQNTAGSSNILMGLLKDPAVTVSFLRNISMMQELIKLLPANNNPVSAEIEQLFNSLLVAADDISGEMLMQELNSTQFRGELFDELRLAFNSDSGAQNSILNLLKAVSSHISRTDVLNASANSLQFLGESLAPSSSLSQKLLDLSEKFRADNAFDNFEQLKNEALSVSEEVKRSILFSPKLSKVLSILGYNLSRVNTNRDFLRDAAAEYMQTLDTPLEKEAFLQKLDAFLARHAQEKAQSDTSRVMQVLTKIIGKQADNADLAAISSDKIEKIIQSLLSSPCNFTPLLHYVIPVEFMDMKAFAEMWVNPNGGEDERPYNGAKEVIHLLVIFDIENVGRFETEIYAKDKNLDISVLCPPDKLDYFKNIGKRISRGVADTGYRINEVTVDRLIRTRSLMEVFKSLPYKRTGVDVTV